MSGTASGPESSYAGLRARFLALRAAPAEAHRSVQWCDSGQRLGVARDEAGQIEIFISGPPLGSASSLITSNLAHNVWRRANGGEFAANRIVLPPASHFDAVAAFICTELIENGALRDPAGGFLRTEPVIEMAIQQLSLRSEALIGLAGELLLLRGLLDRCPPSRVGDVLGGWHGHHHSARDFQLGEIGLEVKTTRARRSRHRIHGAHQVSPGTGVAGVFESKLFLVSIGIEEGEAEDADATWSLPDLVEGLMARIHASDVEAPTGVCADLLARIRSYGGDGSEGYDHEQMKDRIAFGQRWRTVFTRSYDLGDESVGVLRLSDVVMFPMVESDSLEFTVDLPEKVDGDINPTAGLSASVTRFMKLAWDLSQ